MVTIDLDKEDAVEPEWTDAQPRDSLEPFVAETFAQTTPVELPPLTPKEVPSVPPKELFPVPKTPPSKACPSSAPKLPDAKDVSPARETEDPGDSASVASLSSAPNKGYWKFPG